ncbi:MAG: folate-binding protein [Methyloceanibacter sp.]
MGQCHAALLSDRCVLRVAGEDARKFLQGLITSDINALQDGGAVHAGLLNPQGKILFDFFVVAANGIFLLDISRETANALQQRLGFYRLRAAVEIGEEPSLQVAAAWGERPHLPAGAIAYADPRLPKLGFRVLLPAGADLSALGCMPATEQDYHALRISLGVPEGGRDYAFGEAFPHEALFDQLHGVDFAKGCFIGQEVVSRMEHRGTARKRIVPVEGNAPLPAPGTSVEAGGVAIGTLGSVHGTSGLALIRLDRAEEALARGTLIQAARVALTLGRADWAQF